VEVEMIEWHEDNSDERGKSRIPMIQKQWQKKETNKSSPG